jgi:hypothetical protein
MVAKNHKASTDLRLVRPPKAFASTVAYFHRGSLSYNSNGLDAGRSGVAQKAGACQMEMSLTDNFL